MEKTSSGRVEAPGSPCRWMRPAPPPCMRELVAGQATGMRRAHTRGAAIVLQDQWIVGMQHCLILIIDYHSRPSQLNSQIGEREKSGALFKMYAKYEREISLVGQYVGLLCFMELFNNSKSVVSSPGLPT